MIVYHGTTQRAARRIRITGFLPRPPSRRVWFAERKTYAQQRARSQARRAHDRPVVLACQLDVAALRERLGSRRVMHQGQVIAVWGPVPAAVLRCHGWLGVPADPAELVHWVDAVLGIKPYKGPGKSHPGIVRLCRWIQNRSAVHPRGEVGERELLALAQQWLPEFFAGVEVDFASLRTLPRAAPAPQASEPEVPPWEQEAPDRREEEAMACLESDKPRRRQRGLELLADLQDPDLGDWCAMFLQDEEPSVRVKALEVLRGCDDVEEEVVGPLAEAEEKTVRAAAIEVLLRHGRETAEWFWRGVTDPEPHVRLTTARHLQELDPQSGALCLQTALYDPHPEVARLARRATAGKGFGPPRW
ncbi:MAG: hypothetical protein AB1505_23130 [Candidatus Latescibacterota bacterium]